MNSPSSSRQAAAFRLGRPLIAAVDLDGTLLGPEGRISEENRRSIAALSSLGIEVVLASGRHFNSMAAIAAQLPEVRWMVSCQGGEVSSVDRSSVLAQAFLKTEEAITLGELARHHGFEAVFYAPEGILATEGSLREAGFYSGLSGNRLRHVSLDDLRRTRIHKVLWMGEPHRIEAHCAATDSSLNGVQRVRTHQRIVEYMPLDVTKASGLEILARHLGVERSQVVAFGDGENDIPMFDWAGTSVAMDHGWPKAIERATHVTKSGRPETALARGFCEIFGVGCDPSL